MSSAGTDRTSVVIRLGTIEVRALRGSNLELLKYPDELAGLEAALEIFEIPLDAAGPVANAILDARRELVK